MTSDQEKVWEILNSPTGSYRKTYGNLIMDQNSFRLPDSVSKTIEAMATSKWREFRKQLNDF